MKLVEVDVVEDVELDVDIEEEVVCDDVLVIEEVEEDVTIEVVDVGGAELRMNSLLLSLKLLLIWKLHKQPRLLLL